MERVAEVAVLVLRRIRRQRTRFLSLAFGFAVAGVLLSGMALYADTMRTTALRYTLAQLPSEQVHLEVRVPTQRMTREAHQRLQEVVTAAVAKEMSKFTAPPVPVVKSATLYLKQGEAPLAQVETRPRSFFISLEGQEAHLEVVQGVFPPPVEISEDDPGTGLVVPVLIGEEAAGAFGLKVGDRLGLLPYWQDRYERVEALVVGIGRVRDPQAPFWAGHASPLSYPAGAYRTLPLMVPQQTLFQGLGRYFQHLTYDVSWWVPVRTEALTPENAGAVAKALGRLGSALRSLPEQPTLVTLLQGALETYTARLFFTGVPLTLLVTQLEGIVLLYLVILGFFLIERQRLELALLRSRGASTLQLMLPFMVEGGLLAALTVAGAPLVAAGAIALLGLTPWIAPLSGGGLLPVGLSARAFLLAGVGAGMGLLALLIPAYLASRSTGVQHRQRAARAQQPPFFLRYRLDLLVLAAVVILGWEISQGGSGVRFSLAGRAVVNPVLYALPLLLVLATAMLFLRVFPFLLWLAARLLEPRGPAWLLLGLWHLARGPRASGALVLLLALTAGTTLFAASFGPTLERNAQERIYYQVGSPLRVEGVKANLSGASFNLVERVAALPGVKLASPVYRGQGVDHSSLLGGSYTMLALDPATFGQVAWYRDDFSRQDLPALLALLAQGDAAPRGIPLPPEANRLGVWVRPGRPGPTVNLYARVLDANDRTADYRFGSLNFSEWRYLEVPLASVPALRGAAPFSPQAPLSLVALVVQDSRGGDTGPGVVYLDDLQVAGDFKQPLVLESFEGPGPWGVIQDSLERSPDSLDYITTSVHSGRRAAAFSWGSNSLFSSQGITPVPHTGPLPAIASTSFLAGSGRRVGDEMVVSVFGQGVAVRVAGQVEFFPTMDPYKEGFLIVNFHRLVEHGRLLVPGGEVLPNELWLTPVDGQGAAGIEKGLGALPFSYRQLLDREERLRNAQVDPFVLGGWIGWLLLAFGATLGVSIAGFVTYTVMGLERRQASVAVLESLGMSSRQVLGSVAVELLILLGVGGLLGALMGSWLGSLLLPFLDITGAGEVALPPLVVMRTWGGVFLVYGGMGVVFGVLLWFVLRWFSRLALQQVLRLEEA